MSRENVEVVRQVYEAVAAGDSEAVLAKYDPGIELDFSRSPFGDMQNKSVYRGHEGLRSFIRERYESWEEVGDQCQELIEAADKVVSVVTTRGRGRESGVAVEQTHYGLWSIDAGKVTSVRWFGTLDQALEAVGGGSKALTARRKDPCQHGEMTVAGRVSTAGRAGVTSATRSNDEKEPAMRVAMRKPAAVATVVTALIVGVAGAGPASASTTVAWKATLAEPIGGLYQSPFDCPPDSGCGSGSGEVIGLGQAQDLIVFFACGSLCDVRTLTFADGSTIVMHEVFSNERNPGNSAQFNGHSYGNPFSGELSDTIVGGTGRFAGATGTASGLVKVAGGIATVRLSGTVTF